jgi:hypothetical protein
MNDTQAALDRLERRLEEQTARIDDLYRELARRGIVPRAVGADGRDALSDETLAIEDAPLARERHERRPRRRSTRLRLGSATGV